MPEIAVGITSFFQRVVQHDLLLFFMHISVSKRRTRTVRRHSYQRLTPHKAIKLVAREHVRAGGAAPLSRRPGGIMNFFPTNRPRVARCLAREFLSRQTSRGSIRSPSLDGCLPALFDGQNFPRQGRAPSAVMITGRSTGLPEATYAHASRRSQRAQRTPRRVPRPPPTWTPKAD